MKIIRHLALQLPTTVKTGNWKVKKLCAEYKFRCTKDPITLYLKNKFQLLWASIQWLAENQCREILEGLTLLLLVIKSSYVCSLRKVGLGWGWGLSPWSSRSFKLFFASRMLQISPCQDIIPDSQALMLWGCGRASATPPHPPPPQRSPSPAWGYRMQEVRSCTLRE